MPSAEGQEVLIVVVGGTFGYYWLLLGGRLVIFFFLPLAFLRLLPMLTLNFGIPRTFLVLVNTFEIFLQFFDNSKISLSFESKLQFFSKIQKKFTFFVVAGGMFGYFLMLLGGRLAIIKLVVVGGTFGCFLE